MMHRNEVREKGDTRHGVEWNAKFFVYCEIIMAGSQITKAFGHIARVLRFQWRLFLQTHVNVLVWNLTYTTHRPREAEYNKSKKPGTCLIVA